MAGGLINWFIGQQARAASMPTALSTEDAALFAALGATADAAVGDASGSINAHARQIAKLLAAALTVNIAPSASAAGLTTYRNINVNSTGVNIKGSSGKLHLVSLFNLAASVRYVKLYDKATAPTVGTDTPIATIPIGLTAPNGFISVSGLTFSNGLGIGATTGIADADTGNPSTNDVVAFVGYI